MRKMTVILFIVIVIANSMGFSGVAGVADDAVRLVLKNFGDDMVQALSKYSDDVLRVFKRYGDEGVQILKNYGDDAARAVSKYGAEAIEMFSRHGNKLAGLMRRYGDDVLEIASKYGDEGLNAVKAHGYKGLSAVTKYGDDAISLMGKYGDDMAKGLSVSNVPIGVVKRSPRKFARIAREFAGSPYRIPTIARAAAKSGNEVKTLEIMAKYGRRVFDYINDHKAMFAGLTMVGALAVATTNPEIVKEVAPSLGQGVENITAKDSPVMMALSIVIVVAFIIPLVYFWLPKIIRRFK